MVTFTLSCNFCNKNMTQKFNINIIFCKIAACEDERNPTIVSGMQQKWLQQKYDKNIHRNAIFFNKFLYWIFTNYGIPYQIFIPVKYIFYTIAPNQLRSIKCSTNAIPWHLYFARYNGISYDLIFILNTHEGRWDIKCRNE